MRYLFILSLYDISRVVVSAFILLQIKFSNVVETMTAQLLSNKEINDTASKKTQDEPHLLFNGAQTTVNSVG
jgi:hypothetical protein